jgi:hypothetical protein
MILDRQLKTIDEDDIDDPKTRNHEGDGDEEGAFIAHAPCAVTGASPMTQLHAVKQEAAGAAKFAGTTQETPFTHEAAEHLRSTHLFLDLHADLPMLRGPPGRNLQQQSRREKSPLRRPLTLDHVCH